MNNKNARVIIPLAVGAWLASMVVFSDGAPAVLGVAFTVALLATIPTVVFYLMAEQGWSTLARRYRDGPSFSGTWRPCPSAQMSTVSIDHADFAKNRLRFVSTLRLGTAADALHLSMLFSKVPLLGRFFPEVRIPWRAVTSARTYEAPGWVAPMSQPGTLLRASYDPNYTGTFVELSIGDPPVFLQLPLALLGEDASRLPLESPVSPEQDRQARPQ